MRIVHVITSLGIGGAERMVQRLVETHARNDQVESIVISLTSVGVIGEELKRAGFAVEALHMRSGLAGLVALARLRARLRALAPDVVQTWLYHADLIGGIAARLAGVNAIVWNLRGIDHGRSRITGVIVRINAWLSHMIPHSVLCCGHSVRDHHARLGFDRAKLSVLPNGYDLDRFVPASDNKNGQGPLMIALGRNDILKDYPTLIAAFANARQRIPGLRGAIYGRGCSHDAALRQQVAACNLGDALALHEEIGDVRTVLATATLLASSSTSEGFPNVIAEAMAMGIPCAVTEAGDSALIVGNCGHVVPPGNAAALADAIVNIATLAPTDYSDLARRARRRIADNFEMGMVARHYLAHYESLSS